MKNSTLDRMFWTVLLLVFVSLIQLFVLIRLTGPSECHMTSLTSQVCEYVK